jgi:hypothetical protein
VICEICELPIEPYEPCMRSANDDGMAHTTCIDGQDDPTQPSHRNVVDSLTAERFNYTRWRQHRGCERKVGYHCQLDANAAIMRAYDRGATQLRTYECDHCGLLHLTKDVKETA